MKFSETYRYAKARRSGRKPFHLYKRRPLDSDTSWGEHDVELVEARRGAKHGHDRCYEVRYVMWLQGLAELWPKIVIQTPCRRCAQLVFEACLDDKTTGIP
jgi:hypothetical protein